MQSAQNDELPAFDRTPMKPVSAEVDSRSRKNLSMILNRLGSVGQVHAASAIGVHESTINKMKEKGDFERTSLFLAFLGLKVVPVEMKCFDVEQMEAILTLAKSRLNEMESIAQLSFED